LKPPPLATSPGTRLYSIPVADLNGRDVVTVGKEAMTAEVLHDEDGNITGVVLQGGDKYGAQELGNDAVIYADAKPTPAASGAAGDGLRFSMEPKGDGQLLAPNGKPSNLNARQWAQVRTPQFKAWFGDWEFLAQVKNLMAASPVIELTGDEFKKDTSPITEKVTSFYEKTYGGAVENQEIGKVVLDKEGVKSSLGHGIGREKAAAFAAVPEIIRSGKVFDRQENRKGRGYDTFVIAASFKMGGVEYIGEVVVAKRPASQKFYLHEVEIKQKLQTVFKTATEGGTAEASRLIIAQKLNSSNFKDVSKVVDANGEPMVVWHGGRKFDVFNATEESGANFAIADEDAAQTYADQFRDGEVKPLFLNVSNPKIIEGAMPRSGDPVLAELRAAGFDGVIATDTDSGNKGKYKAFAFFDSAQAKLAPVDHDSSWGTPVRNEGNTGAFSAKNPDIRYSIEPVAAPSLGAKEKMLSAVVTRGILLELIRA
jgi:hypothetical protein